VEKSNPQQHSLIQVLQITVIVYVITKKYTLSFEHTGSGTGYGYTYEKRLGLVNVLDLK